MNISPTTFTKLRRNQEVALSVLLKIADVLDCGAGEMMSFVKCTDEANDELNSSFNSEAPAFIPKLQQEIR